MKRISILLLVLTCFALAAWPQAQRNPQFTTFDAPGAGTAAGQGTVPLSINPAGAVAGWYIDASGVTHGFLRK